MAKLDDADQKLLGPDHGEGDFSAQLHTLEKFGQTTREAHRICVEKRWSLKLRGGQRNKIIVRDLLGKIIRWVDVFKGIADQAVAVDQVHTALPWAGARFLLQVGRIKKIPYEIFEFAKFSS